MLMFSILRWSAYSFSMETQIPVQILHDATLPEYLTERVRNCTGHLGAVATQLQFLEGARRVHISNQRYSFDFTLGDDARLVNGFNILLTASQLGERDDDRVYNGLTLPAHQAGAPRLAGVRISMHKNLVETTAAHEIGHMLGYVGEVGDSHCSTQTCLMFMETTPIDTKNFTSWVDKIADRLPLGNIYIARKYGVEPKRLCPTCEQQLVEKAGQIADMFAVNAFAKEFKEKKRLR